MIISKNTIAPILVVHTGGLGDLVLASRLVEGLIKRFPTNRIVLLVRQPFAHLPALFPSPPLDVLTLDFEPHQQTVPTAALRLKLQKLTEVLRDLHPTIFIAADLEPSWLSWFLISILSDCDAFGLTASSPPHGLLTLLIRDFGGAPRNLDCPTQTHGTHENERYSALLRHLGGTPSDITPWPKPLVDTELFRALGIEPGKYIACFPSGAASTLVKRWDPAHYAAVLAGRLGEDAKLLLTGEERERPTLEQFKEAFGADARHIRIFTGSSNAMSQLSVLLAHARLYFGNDTGPAHLAQAYGVPGVVVFGGGTWPHYAPWGQGSVGVVQPMGCFGCRWDCAFGHAYCLETLPVEVVRQAFDRASGPVAPASVIEVQAQAERQTLLKETAEAYHRIQRERRERVAAAVELHGDLLLPLSPIEQEDQQQTKLQQMLAQQMKALQSVDGALRAFLPAAGVSVKGYDDLELALRQKLIRDKQRANETDQALRKTVSQMLQANAKFEQSNAQVNILSEGLAEARRQLEAAGQREQANLADLAVVGPELAKSHAELAKFRQEGLLDYLKRWWASKRAGSKS